MGKFLFPPHRILSITLVIPLFIQVFQALGIGIHLNVLALFVMTFSLFMTAIINRASIGINKISIAFLFFFLLSVLQIITFSKILPVLFFFQCFLLTLFMHDERFSEIVVANRKLIYWVSLIYIGASLVLLALGVNFDPNDGRFYGLGYSPTTFVIYLVVFLTLFHYVYKANKLFYLLFALSVLLTFFSGTRTGLLLLLMLPINNFFYDRYLHGKRWIRVLLILFIMAVYPLTDLISVSNPELLEYRMTDEEEKVDYSYATRIAFTADVVSEWVNGSFVKKMIGFGTEFSRLTILRLYDEDHQLHNDFLRFIVDFGIPAAFFFVVIIYSFSRNNKYSFFLVLIYLFSFYHNMIYEVFLFNTLLFMDKAGNE